MILAWKPVVEILILWFLVYHVLLFFAGTRAFQVLRGIIIIVAAFFLFQKLGLVVLDWLLVKMFAVSVIAVLIIFHPEIRQGLARLGQRHLFGTAMRREEVDTMLFEIGRAVENLAKSKVGALIAIEKTDPLNAYVETGVLIDAKVSSELVESIFAPTAILHDGGLVIQHGRVSAASCLFHLTENQELSRLFGTRHRAALGLSEETDAIIIVVSEERQDISLVYGGRLFKDLSSDELVARAKELLIAKNG